MLVYYRKARVPSDPSLSHPQLRGGQHLAAPLVLLWPASCFHLCSQLL